MLVPLDSITIPNLLDTAGIPDMPSPIIFPGSAGERAKAAGATIYMISKDATSMPSDLEQLTPRP